MPRAGHGENIFDRVRAVATRNNFNVHDVSVQDLGGRLHVEQHLELDENSQLKDAHDQVTVLEAEIRRKCRRSSPSLRISRASLRPLKAADEVVRDSKLEKRLKAAATEFPEILDMHDIEIKRVRGRLYVSCHCTMSDDMPLSRVHDISPTWKSVSSRRPRRFSAC